MIIKTSVISLVSVFGILSFNQIAHSNLVIPKTESHQKVTGSKKISSRGYDGGHQDGPSKTATFNYDVLELKHSENERQDFKIDNIAIYSHVTKWQAAGAEYEQYIDKNLTVQETKSLNDYFLKNGQISLTGSADTYGTLYKQMIRSDDNPDIMYENSGHGMAGFDIYLRDFSVTLDYSYYVDN